MHLLFATPELAPFAASTGSSVAETIRQTSFELKRLGHDVTIVMPLYRWLNPNKLRLAKRLQPITITDQNETVVFDVYEGRSAESVRVFFLANTQLFGKHQDIYTKPNGQPFHDNGLRFGLFSRAVCEFVSKTSTSVDVIHTHEWATALIPVFLEETYAEDEKLAEVVVVQSIQNFHMQGRFNSSLLKRLSLPKHLAEDDQIGANGQINLLQGGILFSDLILTSSPTYAKQIQTPEFAEGLEESLKERTEEIEGVLLGFDTESWDPREDDQIIQKFDPTHLNGKRQCKAGLQNEHGLLMRPRIPLLGLFGPLDEHDGGPLFLEVLPTLVEKEIQILVFGPVAPPIQRALKALNKEHPQQVIHQVEIDPASVRRFISGCDLLLNTSKVDPVGGSVRRAMRYGTLPVAFSSGAIADLVTEDSEANENTNGFLYKTLDAENLLAAVERAQTLFANQRDWRGLQLCAMAQKGSWKKTAQTYSAFYKELS